MSQHLLLLQPTDVLFFKDGRPMEGSSAGHGAAWPLPNVLDSALHHALRRAEFTDITPHAHTVKRSGKELSKDRELHGRKFGSLKSVGPFPVYSHNGSDVWYFPRPVDASLAKNIQITHQPLGEIPPQAVSSLPSNLKPVISTVPPSKDKAENWISREAWQAYLDGGDFVQEGGHHYINDHNIFDAEHYVGIGIDPATDTQDGERIYSASYLRLRRDYRMGMVASCMDKGKDGSTADIDLLEKTFLNSGHQNYILAGGQQRICTVLRSKATQPLPLPVGRTSGFAAHNGKHLVKWVLLTPAIFPYLPQSEKNPQEHPGGWLPSWIHPESYKVQLKDPTVSLPERNKGEARADYRRRLHQLSGNIKANLVAAMVSKPLPITGWALTKTHHDDGSLIHEGGARSTHLAVPAGSVYYFECDNADEATKLAAALNWHGSDTTPANIQNRRSTLLGEKGFGIGVCGTWQYHPAAVNS